MRKMLLFAGLLMAGSSAHAQYMYGMSTAAGTPTSFVRFDPATNTFKTLIGNFAIYQPVSTKDTAAKMMHFVVQFGAGVPDTLYSIKLATNTITKLPVTRGVLGYPQYTNGKIVSISTGGMGAYDLTTHTYSVTDAALKPTKIHSTAYDRPNNRYLYMKHGPGSNVDKDSLFTYDMTTKMVTTFLVDCSNSSQEMQYSPKSNKIVFLGSQTNTANFGVYSYDLTTQIMKYEAPITGSNGVLVNSSCFDEVGNRYFAVMPSGTGTQFDVIEYNLATSTFVHHNVGAPGIGFGQFFYNVPLPAGIGSANEDNNFTLYPNPAKDLLRVDVDFHGQPAGLRVLDVTGKLLLEKTAATGHDALDIHALAPGRYMLSICFADRTISRMFEKQ